MPLRFPAIALLAVSSLGTMTQAADTYNVDAVHSSINFRVKHMNTSHAWGRFNDLSGSFVLDEANPASTVLDFQVKTDSIDTGNAKRDQHLKSPDFFSAVQYPTIAFKSTAVTKSAKGYDVVGDLTLHGVTKAIKVTLSPVGKGKGPTGGEIAGIDATFTIKQSDFGMKKMVGPIGDDVWVNVSIEGVKK